MIENQKREKSQEDNDTEYLEGALNVIKTHIGRKIRDLSKVLHEQDKDRKNGGFRVLNAEGESLVAQIEAGINALPNSPFLEEGPTVSVSATLEALDIGRAFFDIFRVSAGIPLGKKSTFDENSARRLLEKYNIQPIEYS